MSIKAPAEMLALQQVNVVPGEVLDSDLCASQCLVFYSFAMLKQRLHVPWPAAYSDDRVLPTTTTTQPVTFACINVCCAFAGHAPPVC